MLILSKLIVVVSTDKFKCIANVAVDRNMGTIKQFGTAYLVWPLSYRFVFTLFA